MNQDDRDTRDIAVATKTELAALRQIIEDDRIESREHRKNTREQLDRLNALVDRGRGAAWGGLGLVTTLGCIAGAIGGHLPSWLSPLFDGGHR